MWEAELRIENPMSEMATLMSSNEDLTELSSWASKMAREISGNKMLIVEVSNRNIVYRDGEFIAGYANFWEET